LRIFRRGSGEGKSVRRKLRWVHYSCPKMFIFLTEFDSGNEVCIRPECVESIGFCEIDEQHMLIPLPK
jgi:hypothetical protein